MYTSQIFLNSYRNFVIFTNQGSSQTKFAMRIYN